MMWFKYFVFLSTLVSVFILNQNCGGLGSLNENTLAVSHSSSILDVDLPNYQARVGDRIYIASVFADLFLPMGNHLNETQSKTQAGAVAAKHLNSFISSSYNQDDKPITDSIVSNILNQASDFYGPCFFKELDKSCETKGEGKEGTPQNMQRRKFQAEMDMIGPLAASREGFRLSTCIEITESDRAIGNLTYNLTGNRSTNFLSREHSQSIFEAFYSAKSPNDEILDSLESLAETLKSEGESNIDVWRGLAYTVCKTAGWQIP